MSNKKEPAPGDGLRSLRSTGIFRAVNFELYAKPNAVIMALGLGAMTICVGYIFYMRTKFENMGYYSAVNEQGEETFLRKKSKWD
ncbi:Small integral membrane protein 8 [Blattella germanica]|nr:Small integral membrane protein 8 [Blattella germanica]